MEKVYLDLSLGLGGASEYSRRHPRLPPPRLNLMTSPSLFLAQHEAPSAGGRCCNLLASSSSEWPNLMTSPFLGEIDVNRPAPSADREPDEEEEEEAGASSSNSAVSSVVSGGGAGKKWAEGDHRPGNQHRSNSSIGDESVLERSCSREVGDEKEGGEGSRKKLRLSTEKAALLEEHFKEHCTISPKQKLELAKQLNLRPRQVEAWFQNRRARTKLKQTEVDCEFLRRCCERLREENRRLQKQVQALRALKLSPVQLRVTASPATTLTMCPSCEHVTVASSPNPVSSTAVAAPASPLATPPPVTVPPPADAHQRRPFP